MFFFINIRLNFINISFDRDIRRYISLVHLPSDVMVAPIYVLTHLSNFVQPFLYFEVSFILIYFEVSLFGNHHTFSLFALAVNPCVLHALITLIIKECKLSSPHL